VYDYEMPMRKLMMVVVISTPKRTSYLVLMGAVEWDSPRSQVLGKQMAALVNDGALVLRILVVLQLELLKVLD